MKAYAEHKAGQKSDALCLLTFGCNSWATQVKIFEPLRHNPMLRVFASAAAIDYDGLCFVGERSAVLCKIAMILALGLFLIAPVFSFVLRDSSPPPSSGPLPQTAVVFTGQDERIEAGLDLLRAGRIRKLVISGVDASSGAGLTPDTFARQFHLSAEFLGRYGSRIVLGTWAGNTLDNAIEASCILRRLPLDEDVLLITSRDHMPRASLALERAFGRSVIRWPVGAVDLDARLFASAEFRKYVSTWFITLLPRSFWTSRDLTNCD